ncbi:hypothetical protein ACWDNI_01980 [Nocardia niigatensis]
MTEIRWVPSPAIDQNDMVTQSAEADHRQQKGERGDGQRKRHPDNRRQHALYLTANGRTTLGELGAVAREAEAHCAGH